MSKRVKPKTRIDKTPPAEFVEAMIDAADHVLLEWATTNAPAKIADLIDCTQLMHSYVEAAHRGVTPADDAIMNHIAESANILARLGCVFHGLHGGDAIVPFDQRPKGEEDEEAPLHEDPSAEQLVEVHQCFSRRRELKAQQREIEKELDAVDKSIVGLTPTS